MLGGLLILTNREQKLNKKLEGGELIVKSKLVWKLSSLLKFEVVIVYKGKFPFPLHSGQNGTSRGGSRHVVFGASHVIYHIAITFFDTLSQFFASFLLGCFWLLPEAVIVHPR